MKSVGIDLHKKTLTLCVVNPQGEPVTTRSFYCSDSEKIRDFFAGLGPFQFAVESTAGYTWLVELLEPLAKRVVLAHPGKLRIIAQSTHKSDKFDARVLAAFLHLNIIPESYRATPRQREHRALVRHRQFLIKERTQLRNKIRRILSDSNGDRRDLFTRAGLEALVAMKLSPTDRLIINQMLEQLQLLEKQCTQIRSHIRMFAALDCSGRETEHRNLLKSVPGVGEVTSEIVLAELGDIQRFRSLKQVVAYAGLAPGRRESAGKSRDLGITKQGSGLLRWALVEAAWRAIRYSARFREIYERLKQRRGGRRAAVAIARRLLEVMATLLRKGEPYREIGYRSA